MDDFVEQFEMKQKEFLLLSIVKKDMADVGLERFNKIGNWLLENEQKYNKEKNNIVIEMLNEDVTIEYLDRLNNVAYCDAMENKFTETLKKNIYYMKYYEFWNDATMKGLGK